MMPNSDPRGRFVHPYLTLMIYSFSCTRFVSICILPEGEEVQEDVMRDVSVGYQRRVGKRVNWKLLSVLYNSWFSLYIQTRACEKGTNVKCFNLVQFP